MIKSIYKILINLAVIGGIALLASLAFFYWYLPSTTHHGDSITVPDLRGITMDRLDEFVTSRDLLYEITEDSAYSTDYPKMSVVKQYPQVGEKVKRNRKIYITLNQNTPPSIPMPDLVDVSVKNAQLILQSSGLILGEITYQPDLAQNAVLEQWHKGRKIKAGEPLVKGSQIDLVVGDGLGNQTFDVPDFIAMDLDEAEFYLVGIGLRMGSVIYTKTDSLAPGSIVRQQPVFGEAIRIGDIVDLWVADDELNTYRNRKKEDESEF